MMDQIESYILSNYTSPDFPQSYEGFIKENYQDIVPEPILGDEKLTLVTNNIIQDKGTDTEYLSSLKDYDGVTVVEPEVDFLKSLALQARYIDDSEYLEWLNDDKMAKVLAEFPTRGDLIDHLGPTIEEIGTKVANDPNLELLINNMTYKSHPLAFYEFSQSEDFSADDGDFGFREWIRKGINASKKIVTRNRNDNKLLIGDQAIEEKVIPMDLESHPDQSELDDRVIESMRNKELTLQSRPKTHNYEIPTGARQDNNPNIKSNFSEGDMANRVGRIAGLGWTGGPKAPRKITEGMVNNLTAKQALKVQKIMTRNSQNAVMHQARSGFAGIADTGAKVVEKAPSSKGTFLKGAAAATATLLIAPKIYDLYKRKKEDEQLKRYNGTFEAYDPKKSVNFSIMDSLLEDINKSGQIGGRTLTKRDLKIIEACFKYLIDAYVRTHQVPLGPRDMSLDDTFNKIKDKVHTKKLASADKAASKIESTISSMNPSYKPSEGPTLTELHNKANEAMSNFKEASDKFKSMIDNPDSPKIDKPEDNTPIVESDKNPKSNSNPESNTDTSMDKPDEGKSEPKVDKVKELGDSIFGSSNEDKDLTDPKLDSTELPNKRKLKKSNKIESDELEVKESPKTQSPLDKARQSLLDSGYSQEEADKLMQSHRFKSANKAMDKYAKKQAIDKAAKVAHGFKDPEPVQNIQAKKTSSIGADAIKALSKFGNRYMFLQAGQKALGGVKDVALALMAPQSFNRAPIN